MNNTKRISKRTRPELKKGTQPVRPQPLPNLTERARAARVEAVRDVINDPAFNLDAAFAKAMRILLGRS